MHFKSFPMRSNSFPIVSESVPGIGQFVIYVDDSMTDNQYLVKLRDRTATIQQVGLFDGIKEQFMNKNATPEEVCEVTANTDSAIMLRDYVDSWVSEREIQKKAGTWKGA